MANDNDDTFHIGNVKSQICGLLAIADRNPPTNPIGKESWTHMALKTLLRAELRRIEREGGRNELAANRYRP